MLLLCLKKKKKKNTYSNPVKSLGSVFHLAPASMRMTFLKAISEPGHPIACIAVSY